MESAQKVVDMDSTSSVQNMQCDRIGCSSVLYCTVLHCHQIVLDLSGLRSAAVPAGRCCPVAATTHNHNAHNKHIGVDNGIICIYISINMSALARLVRVGRPVRRWAATATLPARLSHHYTTLTYSTYNTANNHIHSTQPRRYFAADAAAGQQLSMCLYSPTSAATINWHHTPSANTCVYHTNYRTVAKTSCTLVLLPLSVHRLSKPYCTVPCALWAESCDRLNQQTMQYTYRLLHALTYMCMHNNV